MRFINALVSCSVIAITSSSVLAQSTAVQWTTASGGNGHWYALSEEAIPLSRAEIIAAAAAKGAQPIMLATKAEELFVYAQFGFTLLGNSADAGSSTFTWMADPGNTYSNWGTGACSSGPYPNNPTNNERFAYLQSAPCPGTQNIATQWDDYQLSESPSSLRILFEWSADCNSDGIVDYGQCHDGSLPDYNGNNIPDCCEQGVACVAGSYPVCWRIEDGGNGHWYQLGGPFLSTWTSAKTAANQSGGHLVTLTSATEQSFAATIAFQSSPLQIDDCWLGGYQDHAAADYSEPAGGWRWVTNEPWAFTAWRPDGHPSGQGDYLAATTVRFDSLGWVDSQMSHEPGNCQAFIEWSADCNNDGIVDYGQILSGQLIDANSNGIPDICDVDPCPGDISGNGAVDGVDLSVLLGVWGTDGSGGEFDADVTNDGIVNGADLTIILGGWGSCPN